MTSPGLDDSQNPFSFHNNDMSGLDFLSFMGIDGSDLDAKPTAPDYQNGGNDEQEFQSSISTLPEAGPSSLARHTDPSDRGSFKQGSRRISVDSGTTTRAVPGRGRPRGRPPKRASVAGRDASSSKHDGVAEAMEVDTFQGQFPQEAAEMRGLENLMGMEYGRQEGFDHSQAGLLQQQLEHIHMQSPIVFDPSNPQSAFHSMAQTYLTAPSGQQSDAQQIERGQAKWGANNLRGILTPAPSGDMFPEIRGDLMSPMQLEMLSRTDGMDGLPDFNMIPLLSPALSQQNNSNYASPATHASFPSNPSHNVSFGQNRSPLEQLQEQQRHFQEQLLVLQEQQKQLQATAAAVAASSSPYVLASGSNSAGPSRITTTPNVGGQHSGGTTPSPAFFSPLTSPALEASSRAIQYQTYSPAVSAHSHNSRPAHPLSALSSPALNPIGSSGGAQQTLSPALEPQQNQDLADPDYIRALVGFLDSQGQPDNGGGNNHQPYQSSMIGHQRSSASSSPLAGSSVGTGTGPHRSALPTKSRPSPMMKPTNHRSHHRQSSSSTTGGFSLPGSPLITRYNPNMPGVGYLPPAAVDHRGVQQALSSDHSTPSPVDLSAIMPPPPVPNQSGTPKGFKPMTPASLMNLGHQHLSQQSQQVDTNGLPKRQAVLKAAAVVPSSSKAVPRKSTNGALPGMINGGKKIGKAMPTAGGKRALAMRPPGVGVKAATKAQVSALATSKQPPEGETRKSSHKAAEQKRRDSLKAGFDELRLLLPPINTEALDPETGEPIPGSSAPRLLPKSSLVPDDNPNRGVSKVALLRFGNEYIDKLHERVGKRDGYIERLRDEVRRMRSATGMISYGEDEGEDLLEIDMTEGEEDEFGGPASMGDEEYVEKGELDEERGEDEDEDEDDDEDNEEEEEEDFGMRKKRGSIPVGGKRPSLGRGTSSVSTSASRSKRGILVD